MLQAAMDYHDAKPVIGLPLDPVPLPPGIIRDSREFKKQSQDWAVEREDCDFLLKKVLYMFYGGLFFRSKPRPTRKAALYPVGFLFKSDILAQTDCYYPFDTGAIPLGFYGTDGDIIDRWQDCRVESPGSHSAPRRLVRYLYGTNQRYMKGLVSTAASVLPDPFPWLIRFLRTDFTVQYDTDQRQYRIECQSDLPASFDDLLWVGYPDIYARWFGRIFERLQPFGPERWSYDTHTSARPDGMAERLQQKALDFMRARIDSTL